jgi:hypothetical protein
MKLKHILNPSPIVESDLKVGNMYMVHGYPLLKGLFPNKYYKIHSIDGDDVTLQQVNQFGKITNLSNAPVTHKLSSIKASVQSIGNGDANGLELTNEATASEIVKDLDKVRNDLIKKVDVLIAKKKKLYSNVDIESPMSADEKQLDKDIQSIFSQIQQIIQQKRSLKSESVKENKMMKLKDVLKESAGFNKKIKSDLDSYLKDFKSGTPTHQWAVKEILKSALTDANFHSAAKKVDSLFSRAKYEEDSAKEKSYQNAVERKGREIANKAKWDGYEIIDAISFYTSMTIGHPLGQKINSLKEGTIPQHINKVESKLSLKTLMNEAKFPVYHKTYTSAISSALDWVEKMGYEYDEEETAREIGMGPKKPSEGKTNRFSISLTKKGKPVKQHLQIQVYNMGTFKRNSDGSKTRSMWGGQNEYELNCYIG